jgi:hypothetical protein
MDKAAGVPDGSPGAPVQPLQAPPPDNLPIRNRSANKAFDSRSSAKFEGRNMKKISVLLTVLAAAMLATAADARPGHGRGYYKQPYGHAYGRAYRAPAYGYYRPRRPNYGAAAALAAGAAVIGGIAASQAPYNYGYPAYGYPAYGCDSYYGC